MNFIEGILHDALESNLENLTFNVYLLPYSDDTKEQNKILRKVKSIFKKINEDYHVGYVYNNDTKMTAIKSDNFDDARNDYIETSFRKYKEYRMRPKKKQIIIEI
jgi:hypothetical protein